MNSNYSHEIACIKDLVKFPSFLKEFQQEVLNSKPKFLTQESLSAQHFGWEDDVGINPENISVLNITEYYLIPERP